MLLSLRIKNIALIDSCEIEFEDGLNILSGETGSGKSVIIESVNFALGGKADKTMIRNGEEECSVQAVFSVKEETRALLDELGIEADGENILVINRRFSADGRGSVKINGENSNTSVLRKITSGLIDIHGQSEHYALLKNSAQLEQIDRLDPAISDKKIELGETLRKIAKIDEQIKAVGGSEEERIREAEILRYEIDEIENASIKEGEEEELLIKRKKLASFEKIAQAFSAAHEILSAEGGAVDLLTNAAKNIGSVSDIDEEYQQIYSRLSDNCEELSDLQSTMSDIIGGLEYDESELNSIEERLDAIKEIKRKYGKNYNEISSFLYKAKERLSLIENADETFGRLSKLRKSEIVILREQALSLSLLRKKVAERFCEQVTEELKELGMERSKFSVFFEEFPLDEDFEKRCSSNGADSIEFMLSPNLGEPLKPLSKIISGGEMSRFMLAIKTVSNATNTLDTYIFDEIDAGISGKIAKVVARKFARISLNRQVIAISHQPSIIAMADQAFQIKKTEENERTFTKVERLNEEGKLYETVRLIGGESSSTAAREHANELISLSDQFKNSLKKSD